ncbi:phage holin, LLH family [Cohnella abietis]|uniref:Phage holin n=1 Tax=Cohnella abietis TaxID=2507935 RepID=A0A3T1D324_9BACL|nr:phage holin, LLH family [Cohnella abietis]BBI32500.1 hypothetical protein KCTCHS21_18990 [Cohnella abietis]
MLQPYIDGIVGALIGLLVTFMLGLIAMLRVRVNAWLDAKTNLQQREILHRLAQEGMSLAENLLNEADGPKKFDEALEYVRSRATKYGIKLTGVDIRAAIEKAVLDYNAKVKGGG